MSTFATTIHTIKISAHPNADALELAHVGAYVSIVKKGQFQTGDRVAYIQEQSLLPEALLDELGLRGRLAGSEGNRVKAVKLRGVLSQGICYPARPEWEVGQDVSEILGITKWEPPIPAHLGGQMLNLGSRHTATYDIENYKGFPDVLVPGEEIVATEKIHGTCCQVVLLPKGMEVEGKRVFVGTKGMGAKGLVFREEVPNPNVYIRATEKIRGILEDSPLFVGATEPVILLGEVFGEGVQDLHYGVKGVTFRAFDIVRGFRGGQNFLDDSDLDEALNALGIPRVPVLFRGPFDLEALMPLIRGRETLSGNAVHIREGIVVRTTKERKDPQIPALEGRVQLKLVSEDYLLRKGGTEHN